MTCRKLFAWEEKVWGSVAHLFLNDRVAISHLRVNAGFRCSRHYHRQRANQFSVLSGRIAVDEFDCFGVDHSTVLGPGESFTVPSGIVHQFRVLEVGEVVEVYWADRVGGSVDQYDIVRLDEGGPDFQQV